MARPSRKNDIIAAATENFARHGYSATRVRDIAELSGLSEAAIYRHFSSIDELSRHIYSENLADYTRILHECIVDGEDAETTLRRVVRATLSRYRLDRFSFVATMINTPNFLPTLPVGTAYPLELVERVVERGQNEGIFRAGPKNLIATMFAGAMLRPFLLAELAAPGTFDLLTRTHNDSLIEDIAVATVLDR